MNREIKFRGLRTDGKGFSFGNLIKAENIKGITYYEIGYGKKYYRVIHESVCQYTGLLDTNGKEIFEGDILANENRDNEDNVYVCEYISKEARYYFTSPFDGEILDENDIVEELVIIGNIHENPELC